MRCVVTVKFQVLTVASMKMSVFWDVAPCYLAEIDQNFRGAYCDHVLMMEAVRTSERRSISMTLIPELAAVRT
jgi:hypothetical protein